MFTGMRFSKTSIALAIATCSALAAPPALAGDFPAGAYTVPGVTLTFEGNGHFRATQKDAMKVEGDYTIDGDQLQITDKSGPWACTKPAEQTGTYRWKAEGDTLTFSKVADTCKDRVDSLTPHPWKKQS
jgi:hypothetical protein